MKETFLTLASIRKAMSFSAYPQGAGSLDDLIIEHLDTVRALKQIDGKMASLVVLVSQGYNIGECSTILGLSRRTVARRMKQMRDEFFTDVVIPQISMEAA